MSAHDPGRSGRPKIARINVMDEFDMVREHPERDQGMSWSSPGILGGQNRLGLATLGRRVHHVRDLPAYFRGAFGNLAPGGLI